MRRICLLIALCLGFAGCSTLDSFQPAPPGPVVAGPSADALKPDLLKSGDAVQVTVAGEEEVSGVFLVASDGTVHMELVGAVKAAGLTPAAFQDSLRTRLAQGYLADPQVTVARAVPQPQPAPQPAPQVTAETLPPPQQTAASQPTLRQSEDQ